MIKMREIKYKVWNKSENKFENPELLGDK